MIYHNAEQVMVVMGLIDLEHCGFDHDEFCAELEMRGIEEKAAQWPLALVVNYRGGAVVTPDTPVEAREQRIADSTAFEELLRLFEAAPDLLAACKLALDEFGVTGMYTWEALRAAIAKAEKKVEVKL